LEIPNGSKGAPAQDKQTHMLVCADRLLVHYAIESHWNPYSSSEAASVRRSATRAQADAAPENVHIPPG